MLRGNRKFIMQMIAVVLATLSLRIAGAQSTQAFGYLRVTDLGTSAQLLLINPNDLDSRPRAIASK